MNRSDVTEAVLTAKRAKNLTWQKIAKTIDPETSPIVITAGLLGQMVLTEAQAKKAGKLLGLVPEAVKILQGGTLSRLAAAGPADRSADLSLLRIGAGVRHHLEGADQ